MTTTQTKPLTPAQIRRLPETRAAMGRMAQANPTMSIKDIEVAMNLRPESCVSAFKKGTKAYADEVRCYQERLAAWKQRNAK